MPEKLSDTQSSLRRNVNMLGTLLGDVIRDHKGDAFFNKIEVFGNCPKRPEVVREMIFLMKPLRNRRYWISCTTCRMMSWFP